MLLISFALAAETVILLEGEVPTTGPDHFFLPFELPPGIVEVELRHEDLSDTNILDWGLDGPEGFRGWGGGNAEPAIVGELAASRSYLPGTLTPGTWLVVVGKAKIVEEPALYRVEVVLRDEATLAPQPERRPYEDAPALETGARWYAGDFHVHSRESGDASPSLDEIATFATGRGLDFVALSDHNTTSQLEWIGDAQDRHPTLLFVPSVEFTTYDGHANGIGATRWVDHRIGQPGVDIAAAVADFQDQGAFFSINHPNLNLGELCIGCAWEQQLDPGQIRGMEIITGGWDPVGKLFFEQTLAQWEDYLDQGHAVVPIGGSDDHQAGQDGGATASPIGSPTTLVWAEELSVPALLEGLRAGRTVVKLQGPDDPMVELWPANTGIEATVTGGIGSELHWFIRGTEVEVVAITEDPQRVLLQRLGERGRAELWVDGQPRVLTNNLRLPRPIEELDEDCGCAGDNAAFLLFPLLLLRRRYQS